MKNAIELKNVHFKYRESAKLILEDFSLTIKPGEWVSLLGHNGSGKSTIAKIMAGLAEINSGSVKIFDKEYTLDNVYQIRKEICCVFQNPDSQFVGATVEDDVAFGLENHFYKVEEMKPLILDVLKQVEMSDFLQAAPHNLSGGQKQRVAIAGILAISPSIIIFDESTSMLDPKGVKAVNDLIKKIHQEKKITVVTITHNMEETLPTERIVIIEEGKIAFDGEPKDIMFDRERLRSLKLDVPFVADISNELFENGFKNKKSFQTKEVIECLK